MKKANLLIYLFLGIILLSFDLNAKSTNEKQRPNILFIAVDDLKPMLGCYGSDYIVTPNIDKLAGNGAVFTNAHCQQAVCGPSRASIMTGMRPDYTGVWDLKTRMRDINPDILALPQYFRQNGYTTVATGKIYDYRCVDKQADKPSWSIPYSESTKYTYPEVYGEPAQSFYASSEAKEIVAKLEAEAREKGQNVWNYTAARHKPSVECADFPDEAYKDGQICNIAIDYLQELSKKKEPFFLAVGFARPHLPFSAPKKYWDLYNREEIALAEYPKAVKDGVDFAYHNSGELKSYTDIPELTDFSDIFNKNLPDDKQKELIHGYQACVSFIDAQVGRIMHELQELGLDKNTVVVLWGDHGWHLGDHGMWCKHSNFEQATRVPLIFKVPEGNKVEYAHPVEFVDVFPTLCDLSGLEVPKHLHGKSLAPAMSNPEIKIKDFAVSQFPRGKRMGYSIRTDRYRLTVWMDNNWRTNMPFNEDLIAGLELYDYKKDPLETQNLSGRSNYTEIENKLMNYLKTL